MNLWMEHWNVELAHASQTVRKVFIYQLTLIVERKIENVGKSSLYHWNIMRDVSLLTKDIWIIRFASFQLLGCNGKHQNMWEREFNVKMIGNLECYLVSNIWCMNSTSGRVSQLTICNITHSFKFTELKFFIFMNFNLCNNQILCILYFRETLNM